MSLVKICDKCKKLIQSGEAWAGGSCYSVNPGTAKVIVKKSKLQVNISLTLESNEDIDICDPCAWKIIEKFVGRK